MTTTEINVIRQSSPGGRILAELLSKLSARIRYAGGES